MTLTVLSAADLDTDQEVRWCPGCGDFSILGQLKRALSELDVPREKLVFVSGYGCSSRLPYYMNTYGFQTMPGRAPAVATGLKLANPDLQVWVVTGDGDGLSIGANHLIHAIRRNADVKILLFNNEVFGFTKGQTSPATRVGTRTKASPLGSVETPLRALSLAIAAEATFAARTVDVDVHHLTDVLQRAARHRGTAFVEIYQNCKVFNDGVFDYATDRTVKDEHTVYLEHGRPLVFGKDRNMGIKLDGVAARVVQLGNGTSIDDLVIHDEKAEDATMAFLLSRLSFPEFPECLGVLRCVERPTYERLLQRQIADVRRQRGPGKLADLLAGDESWTVT